MSKWQQPGLWNQASTTSPSSDVARQLYGQDGQSKPSPSVIESRMGNYGLANMGGGDGVAASDKLNQQQFNGILAGQANGR